MVRNRVGTSFFLLSALLLQCSVFPEIFRSLSNLPMLGFFKMHTVDMMLIIVMYLSLHRNLSETLLWCVFAGIFSNAFCVSWEGALPLTYLFIGILCSALRNHIIARNVMPKMILIAAISVLAGLTELLIGGVLERTNQMFQSMWPYLLKQALINALFGPTVIYIGLVLDRWTDYRDRLLQQGIVFGMAEVDRFESF